MVASFLVMMITMILSRQVAKAWTRPPFITSSQRLRRFRRGSCPLAVLPPSSADARPAFNDNDENTPQTLGVQDTSTKTVHTITWQTPEGDDDDIVFEAYDGELLRTAALRRGLASPHNGRANLINCRGLGTCGTCAVVLSTNDDNDDADNWLPPRNVVEILRLSVPPGHGANSAQHAQRLRLACQVAVHGNLTVQKYRGFWGQYCNSREDMVHPSVPTQPLGFAEFVLDRTSPPAPSKE